MIDPNRESRIATGMLGGIVATVAGVALFLVGVVAGNGLMYVLSVLLFLGGVAAMGISVGVGLGKVRADQTSKAPTLSSNCRVVARFAINHLGEMIFDIEPQDIDDLTYYVRLEFPSLKQGEFKTSWEVFQLAGEGMYGDVATEGDWLGSFTARPRPGGN